MLNILTTKTKANQTETTSTKGPGETFRDDGHVYYRDLGDGNTNTYIFPN